MKNLTLAVITLLSLGFMLRSQQERLQSIKHIEAKDTKTENQKSEYSDFERIDIGPKLPAIKDLVRIHPTGPCADRYEQSFPFNPVAETNIPCRFPHGERFQSYDNGNQFGQYKGYSCHL
ncbi:hypothetical protein SAMN05661096_03970 [Marivirga sericea]|uniref:Uncharacterized protein n=1 Tax=Marivirga sericea TaxID=1028 RepID=A0A1X7LFB8_9BACT|nr:hypothetical protein [Marivirga sericea]SMG52548.1 hypothetical protein SAMN05661096_03970 [Marivirga sericea]